MLAFAEKDRRHGEMHFVDLICKQILANDGDPAADADVFPICRFFGSRKGGVRSVGDEVEGGAALHYERRARVVREHEDRCMV